MPKTEEEIKQYKSEYYFKNKEKNKEKRKEYRMRIYNTPKRKKSMKISNWKAQGIICDDFDALYEKVLNTTNCEECDCILTVDRYNTKTTRCLDHDHSITDRENVRNILCQSCNRKR